MSSYAPSIHQPSTNTATDLYYSLAPTNLFTGIHDGVCSNFSNRELVLGDDNDDDDVGEDWNYSSTHMEYFGTAPVAVGRAVAIRQH